MCIIPTFLNFHLQTGKLTRQRRPLIPMERTLDKSFRKEFLPGYRSQRVPTAQQGQDCGLRPLF